jgi:dTDP-4-dehydrorhamnose reductase
MSILIVGGDSAIAKCYIQSCKDNKLSFKATSRRKNLSSNFIYFDLNDPNFDVFNDQRFNFVIFFASICSIDFCEKNKKKSHYINVENTKKSLDEFSKISNRLLFLSSNAVFDGKHPFRLSNDDPNPINEYGRHKLEVEEWIKHYSKKISVLRLSKVIHPYYELINDWRNNLDQGFEIYPFTNKFFSPTHIKNVLEKIEEIRKEKKISIFHCASSEDISYYEYALKLFQGHSNKNLIKKGLCKNVEKTYSSLK